MKKEDLQDVLKLVKEKLRRDVQAACGIFWVDETEPTPTTTYAVGEEDSQTFYSVGE